MSGTFWHSLCYDRPMSYAAGISSTNSRTLHLIVEGPASGVLTTDHHQQFPAVCGVRVWPRGYALKPSNEVCKTCRRLAGWPFIVTWTDKYGNEHTTDFN